MDKQDHQSPLNPGYREVQGSKDKEVLWDRLAIALKALESNLVLRMLRVDLELGNPAQEARLRSLQIQTKTVKGVQALIEELVEGDPNLELDDIATEDDEDA